MKNSKMTPKKQVEKNQESHDTHVHNKHHGHSNAGPRNILREYRMVLLIALANVALWLFSPLKAGLSLNTTSSVFKEMLMILPPMFVFVGLIDQWIPKEIIHKYVGKDSGFKGTLITMSLGSLTVGPLYAGFPIAAMLLKKGARLSNVVAFLTVKAAAELPLLLMETKFVGLEFALWRLALTFASAVIMGRIVEAVAQKWPLTDRPWDREDDLEHISDIS